MAENDFTYEGLLNDYSSFYGNDDNQYVEFIVASYNTNNKLKGWLVCYRENVTKAEFTSVVDVLLLSHGDDYRVEDGALVWDLGNNRTCTAGPADGQYMVIYGQE